MKRRERKTPPDCEVRVEYDDGHERFTSLAQFDQAGINISKVLAIEYGIIWQRDSDDWIDIAFGAESGLSIAVHSLDRLWAVGLTDY